MVPGTAWAAPGVPLVMGTTTPWAELLLGGGLVPTPSQVVVLGQATPVRVNVPGTVRRLPGVPLVMGTTTPGPEEESPPTATQVVALGQATSLSVPALPQVPGTI